MKAFSATVIAIFYGLLTVAKAQTVGVKRPDAAYHADDVLDPKTPSPKNFKDVVSGRYVVVEGFIDYVISLCPLTIVPFGLPGSTSTRPAFWKPRSQSGSRGFTRGRQGGWGRG